jgi:hypothetical protein
LPGFVKFLSEELHMNQEDLLEVIPESGDNNNEESLQLQETH